MTTYVPDALPLVARYPSLARQLPWVPLGEWPTPCSQIAMPQLAGELWVKHDDVSGLVYGGNKVRKLELILAEALQRGARSVWTVGALGSHHCLATAIYGTQLGLQVHVLHFPQPITAHVRQNVKALLATGAQVTLASRNGVGVELARRLVKAWLTGQGDASVYVPAGGSSELGTLGYVNAAFELAAQIAAGELPAPQRIYVPAGTGGTVVGLWLGCGMAGLDTEVVGVRVVDRLICNGPLLRRLAAKVARLLATWGVDVDRTLLARPLRLVHDQFGEEYGRPTPQALAAIEALQEAGGPRLEFTYTGKTFAGVLAVAAAAELPARTLLWNTYNGRSIDALAAKTTLADLPESYRGFFAGPPAFGEA